MLSVDALWKTYVGTDALRDVSLEVSRGEYFCILGPSGAGKSTLLRIIAGLEQPSAGRVYIDGRDMDGIPARERPTRTVFQDFALFPHMTANGNVAFAAEIAGLRGSKLEQAVTWAMDAVRLRSEGNKKPGELSGGQKQRVALARAIVSSPSILLLDEPLGSLDMALRREMRELLRELQEDRSWTTIHVTHDQEEAFLMCDRLAIIDRGEVMQVGAPRQIYESPASVDVATFTGVSFAVECRVVDGGDGARVVRTPTGCVLKATFVPPNLLGPAVLVVRPDRLLIGTTSELAGGNAVRGTVTDIRFVRGETRYMVASPDIGPVAGVADPRTTSRLSTGDTVFVTWAPEASIILPLDRSKGGC